MAVMVVLYVKGGTLEQYDQSTNELFGTLQPGPDQIPDGLLSHAVAATDDGVKVVDVWQSKEQFEAFAARLMPALQHANVPPTEPKFYEVHNFIKG